MRARDEERQHVSSSPDGKFDAGGWEASSSSSSLGEPTDGALARPDRPGRNEPCWCGSGTKYKRCHLAEDEAGDQY